MDSITSGDLLNFLSSAMANSSKNVIVLAASIVFGVVLCFLGLKVIKFLSGVIGFFLGVVVGTIIGAVADISGFTYIILVFGCAILLAVLGFFIHRVSVFLFTFFVFFTSIIVVLGSRANVVYVIAAAVGIILAICSMIFMEPMIIVVTAIWGGLCAGDGIAQMMKIADADKMGFVIGGGMAIVGMLIQFILYKLKANKGKKKNKGKKNDDVDMIEDANADDDVDDVDDSDDIYDDYE